LELSFGTGERDLYAPYVLRRFMSNGKFRVGATESCGEHDQAGNDPAIAGGKASRHDATLPVASIPSMPSSIAAPAGIIGQTFSSG